MRIALCQLTSTNDKNLNFNICHNLLKSAKQQDVQVVFLPECFDYIGQSRAEIFKLAENLDGALIGNYKNIAKDLKIWLSLGGFHNKKNMSDDKIFNTHIIINDQGEIVSTYDKIHMFNLDIPGKIRLFESDTTNPGSSLALPVSTPFGKVGLQICYDIRFPYPSNVLRFKGGADVLLYPSAFTIPTGKLHWETLNRCRAIDNQCYVISAAQVGKHNEKRSSYGHSMVVDPMGKILLDMGEEANTIGIVTLALSAEKYFENMHNICAQLPMMETIKSVQSYSNLYEFSSEFEMADNYSDLLPTNTFAEYPFSANIRIPASQVFARNNLCYAFINRAPLLPGHVLITTLREGARTLMSDCTPEEVTDLFQLTRKVGRKALIPTYFSSEKPSFNITIQDGEAAGRTVPQIHVHVIPRHSGDMPSGDDNEIYRRLASHDKEQAFLDSQLKDDSTVETTGGHSQRQKQPWRTSDDMAQEADKYRKLLYKQ